MVFRPFFRFQVPVIRKNPYGKIMYPRRLSRYIGGDEFNLCIYLRAESGS